MANRLQQDDDDELSEILRLAIRKDGSTSSDLQQRLRAAADELGISPEAVAAAEIEYRQQTSRQKELALYTKEARNAVRLHFGIFVLVNICMACLNLITWAEDKEIWFQYVVLFWGLGLAIHAFVASRPADWDDEEFQKWRRKRAERALE